MSGPSSANDPPRHDAAEETALKELREIIAGPVGRRLGKLEERIAGRGARARWMAESLADSVRHADDGEGGLRRAMAPVLEGALKHAAERQPDRLSDALAPVLGPSIRKSIRHAIQSMLQSLNQTLEHAFSPRGLKWRLDAWRSGRPYAEIVLLNTLVWRVEQVFLIHRESGLLLAHVAREPAHEKDADVISGMLTAIRDFARDSFGAGPGEEIERLRLGETEIWLASGADVLLALVCRGKPPEHLAERMQECVEQVQRRWGKELAAFDGEAAALAGAEDMLRDLLDADYRGDADGGSSRLGVVVLGGVLLALAVWGGYAWHVRHQWQAFVARVDALPGVVVTHSSGGRPFRLQGMRDPLARDPLDLLPGSGIRPDEVRMEWTPFQSLRQAFVLRRARRALNPPGGAVLTLRNGVLHISGEADADWVARARMLAPALAGVQAVDTSALHLPDVAGELLRRLRETLQPPEGVRLRLTPAADGKHFILRVSGAARRGWLQDARRAVAGFSEVSSFDASGATVLDDPRRLLRLARRALRPPEGVRLRVSRDLRLVASGVASMAWKRRARKAAASIPFLRAYDDRNVRLPAPKLPAQPDDAAILVKARTLLAPPPSLMLEVRDGVIFARGAARDAWLARARRLVAEVPGARGWDDAAVRNADMLWEQWRRKLAAMLVRYAFSTARPRGDADGTFGRAAEVWQRMLRLDPEGRLAVVGISQASGERQRQQALRFARDAVDRLTAHGAPVSSVYAEWARQQGSRRVSGVRFEAHHGGAP